MRAVKRPVKAKRSAERTGDPWRLRAWHVLLAAAAAALALLEIYSPVLRAPFLFDDEYLPFRASEMRDGPLLDWLSLTRPALMLSYWLNYRASGDNTFSYHLVNLLFHLANGVLVFLIVRKFLEWIETGPRQKDVIAAFCGALFLFHPLQTEAVSYVASRSENQSVLFFYSAFAIFLYRRSRAIGVRVTLAVAALFVGAVASKEHTAILPALLLLTDYYWNPGFSLGGIRRNWKLYLPMAVLGILGLAFVWRTLSGADTAGFRVEGLSWHTYLATQCKVIWIYLRMFLFPAGQSIDHGYPPVSWTEPLAIAGLAALLIAIAAAWRYRREFPLVSFGVFVFFLLLAPTSSVVPIRDTLVERRLYLPMIGLLLVAAGLLKRWRVRRTALAGALAAILVAAGFLTHRRNLAWAGPIVLWEDTVRTSPHNPRAHFQLAFAYYTEGSCDEAIEEYEKVAELEKATHRLLVDWALAYDCANRPAEALAKLEEAARLDNTAHVNALIGMVHAKQGENEAALEALKTAEELDANFGMLYVYRGNVYVNSGRYADAIAQYRRALSIDPSLQSARDGLRVAEYRLGRGQ